MDLSGPGGPFQNFPHYKTIDEEKGQLIELSKAQVNLIGHLTYWTAMNSPEILEVLKPAE